VIGRARRILENLEGGELDRDGTPNLARASGGEASGDGQLMLFSTGGSQCSVEEGEVLAELRELDPENTTPMDALLTLQRLCGRMREGELS
jgi:DNA mismatch repair protein MutS